MDWDNVYSEIKTFAANTAARVGHTAAIASLQVKLSKAEKQLEEAYTLLGKIAYDHFTSDDDRSARVAAAVSRVNRAKIAVLAWKQEIAKLKEQGPAIKKQRDGKTEQ